MDSQNTRRDFVGTAAASLLVLAPQTVRGSQANSALTVGVIGYGNRGGYVTDRCFAKNEFAKITAVADINDQALQSATSKYSGAKTFKRYQDLLASDIDAVYIATPIFLHPEHFEAAVNAKKHIFMEKAAAVDPAGCRRVIEAAKKADKNKRISVDFQQRYGKDYRKAYEVVKSGDLGPIKAIRAAWIGGGPKIKEGIPANEEKIVNWYFYKEHSGDMIVEQDCHNIDVVNWFMGTHPVKASGYGSRAIRKYGNVLDNLGVTFHFADGTVFSYTASQVVTGGFQDVGEVFMCEKGTVTTSRKGVQIMRQGQQPEAFETKYDITLDGVNEFIEGARTGKLENAAFHAAESTLTAIMAREAIYSGKEMTWERISKA